ncbi:MAG TPA: NAD-dependent epimerase/dehydratase family protein [Candidatus Obscuribacterales bacterium]
MESPALLLLGVGQVALAAANAVKAERRVVGTTRQPMRIFELFHESIEPIVMPWPSAEVIEPLARDADVLVSIPPDGSTDAILAPACLNSRCVVYISSTGVFGSTEGKIDDSTPVDSQDKHATLRIEAEKIWRSIGANVVRAPGIYGPSFGLHKRLRDGSFRLPGDGSRLSSRIHVDDLAALVLALFASGKHSDTFVVGDLKPASHKEVAQWLCDRLELPLPESAPLDALHYTLRANRAVDPSRALNELGVQLKYPTYKEGYQAILSAEPAAE